MKRLFKQLVTLTLLLLPMVISSCASSGESNSESLTSSSLSSLTSEYTTPYGGIYAKTTHTIDGVDVFPQFVFSTLTLNDNGTSLMEDLDAFGLNELEGTYTYTDNFVDVLVGLKTYNFTYEEATHTLTYVGRVSRRDVVITYIRVNFERPDTVGDVNYDDELFGDDSNSNFYNYCPTIM
ncbi:MAG TPA: hypothetical protein DCM23_01455, partial [Firmicutes bacterium]|nr:hypothetical protein [Bacillota bacterium]